MNFENEGSLPKTPLRSVNHASTLADFNFRFLATSQFAPLPLTDSIRLLNKVVMHHPPTSSGAVSNSDANANGHTFIDVDTSSVRSVDDVPMLLHVLGATNNIEPLSWYRMDSFRCKEFSTVAILVGLFRRKPTAIHPSNECDPVAVLQSVRHCVNSICMMK